MLASIAILVVAANDPAHALAARMDEIAALNARLRRVAQLVEQDRWPEARAAAVGLPHAKFVEPGVRALALPPSSCGKKPRCLGYLGEWTLTETGQPDLAAKLYDRALAGGWQPKLDESSRILDAYLEAAQYDKALAHARALAVKADWVRARIPELETLAAGDYTPLEAARRLSLRTPWSPLARLVEIWRYPPREPSERITKLRLLKEQGLLGADVLARETLAADPDLAPAQATRELVSLASDAARLGRFDDAIRHLDLLLEKKPLPAVKVASLVMLGALRRHQGQFTDAVKLLRGATGLDEDASADAEWELGHALLANGDSADALAAYQCAREYPFPRCCIGDGEETATYHLYAGLSLERLGRTREAVEHYLQARGSFPGWWRMTLAGHLVDLYALSGQLGLLEAMLGPPAGSTCVEPRLTMGFERPSGLCVLRGVIELRHAEDAADWETLASSLPTSGVDVGPESRKIRERLWRAAEAARLLARHPEALPVLSRQLIGSHVDRAPVWAFYALGLMGTPEALALLSEQAMRADRLHVQNLISLLWAMALTPAGYTARQALVEREPLLQRLLEYLPAGVELGMAELDAEFAFPPPSSRIDLPRALPPMPEPAPVSRRTRAKPCTCIHM